MIWTEYLGAFVGACALLLVPGTVVSLALGFRGLTAWATSPAISITLLILTGEFSRLLHIRWGFLAVISPLILGLLGGAFLFARKRFYSLPRMRYAMVTSLALLLAATVIGWQMFSVIPSPNLISQTFDNIFHLNGVRYILDSGRASSLTLGGMTSPEGAGGFYPAAWHTAVASVVISMGLSIPVATNLVTLFVAVIVWPAGMMLLGRELVGRSRASSVTLAVVVAAMPTFPMLTLYFGVLYPFMLATALLPSALGASILVLKRLRVNLRTTGLFHGTLKSIVLCLLTLPALTLAHPSGAVVWLIGTSGVALLVALERVPGVPKVSKIRLWVAVSALVLISIIVFAVVRPVWGASPFAGKLTILQALQQLASFSVYGVTPNYVMAALLFLGFVLAFLTPRIWPRVVSLMFIFFAALFLVVSSLPAGALRYVLVGTWYEDTNRLAALLAIPGALLISLGLTWVWSRLKRISALRLRVVLRRVVAGIGLTALILISQTGGIQDSVRNAEATFALTNESALLTFDELALINRLPVHVASTSKVFVNPWFGASLAYGLKGVEVSSRHIFMDPGKEVELLNKHLSEIAPGNRWCQLVDELGYEYVIQFGGATVIGEAPPTKQHPVPESLDRYRGLLAIEQNPAFELIDSEGDAKLYKITGC